MSRLFQFVEAAKRAPAVEAWLQSQQGELATIATHWFEVMRRCGEDVREVLHDGHPTACVGNAAFAYVGVFRAHVNVGFFLGAELPDPKGMLEGTGKFMRHVKIRPGHPLDAAALWNLIAAAYADMKRRVEEDEAGRSGARRVIAAPHHPRE